MPSIISPMPLITTGIYQFILSLLKRQPSNTLLDAEQKLKIPMTENIRTADHTWIILNQMPNFQQSCRGYLDVLTSNLKQIPVMGQDGKERYRYYTRGQEHDRRNPARQPFHHLMRYCQELGYDFYEARDMIEERVGRKLICECELFRS